MARRTISSLKCQGDFASLPAISRRLMSFAVNAEGASVSVASPAPAAVAGGSTLPHVGQEPSAFMLDGVQNLAQCSHHGTRPAPSARALPDPELDRHRSEVEALPQLALQVAEVGRRQLPVDEERERRR